VDTHPALSFKIIVTVLRRRGGVGAFESQQAARRGSHLLWIKMRSQGPCWCLIVTRQCVCREFLKKMMVFFGNNLASRASSLLYKIYYRSLAWLVDRVSRLVVKNKETGGVVSGYLSR